MKFRSTSLLFAVLIVLFTNTSCAREFPSYGVLLWSTNDALIPSGSLVGVISQSRVQKTYKIQLPGKDNAPINVELWRVKEFGDDGQAKDWMEKNKEVLQTFAVCNYKSLPMRSKPDRQADIVYKLDSAEVIKVISKGPDLVEIGSSKNYWYEVLTNQGHIGYTFGANLDLYSLGSSSNTGGQVNTSNIDIIAKLKSNIWRPKNFAEMIKNSKYDLSEFKPEYGFFIDTQSSTYRLSLKKALLEGVYTNFTQLDPGTWLIDGTTIKLSFKSDGSLFTSFEFESKPDTQEFLPMKDNVTDIVNKELARRQILVKRLSQNGASLVNDNYGTLVIRGSSFTWSNYQALSPKYIPSGLGESGKIDLNTSPSGNVSGRYQGIINFTFDGSETPIPFFFNKSESGLVLSPGDASLVKDSKLESTMPDAPTIVFSKG